MSAWRLLGLWFLQCIQTFLNKQGQPFSTASLPVCPDCPSLTRCCKHPLDKNKTDAVWVFITVMCRTSHADLGLSSLNWPRCCGRCFISTSHLTHLPEVLVRVPRLAFPLLAQGSDLSDLPEALSAAERRQLPVSQLLERGNEMHRTNPSILMTRLSSTRGFWWALDQILEKIYGDTETVILPPPPPPAPHTSEKWPLGSE